MAQRWWYPELGMRIKQRVAELGYVKENGEPDLVRFALAHAWHPQYLDRWAKGTLPSRAHLEKLADQLKTSAAWLHYGIGDTHHGHGPSRGKTSRRQGRRPLASLLLAFGLGGASVLGWASGGAGAEAGALGVVQVPDKMFLIRRWLRRLRDGWARPLLPLGCPA